MRGATLLALVLCAACSPGNEVHVTIVAGSAVGPQQLAQIHTLEIAALGAEPDSIQYPITTELADGKTTWIYQTKAGGPLQLEVVARGDARMLIASGKSPVLTPSSNKSISTTITLGTDPPNPTKSRPGETCTAGVDTCLSGFCVDGVCCESSCDGDCYTCNGAQPGTCTPALPGTNPRTACKADTANSCGLDGTCDGTGICRLALAGSVCTAAHCASGAFTPAATCDGAGNCDTPTTRDCAPYACNAMGTACATICTPTTGCAPAVTCTAGSCGKVSEGARCFGNNECLNGNCVDGYCCDSACTGSCQSCQEPGREGICTKTKAGVVDPHHTCVDAGLASCGEDGSCNGNGACEKYAPGTVCAPGGCTDGGSTYTPPGICLGFGIPCVSPAPIACAPYACVDDGAPGCATSCGECTFYSMNQLPPFADQCASGATCSDHCLQPEASFICQ